MFSVKDAERLRDFSQPIDVALLDATLDAFYTTGSQDERAAAEHILRDLQANPDTWLQVLHILNSTKSLHTKYFALQVLEDVIKYKWNALPVEQRDGMKNYISEVIVQLSRDEASFRSERLYVNKLNVILLQMVRYEWPAKWKSFIPDLVKAAKTSKTICENCMAILKLLIEEVRDFSKGEMTQEKVKELEVSLHREIQIIHELCLYVLSACQKQELICATLSTVHAYLSWIPLDYIFEYPLVKTFFSFLSAPVYVNLSLQCLTEIAAIKVKEDIHRVEYAEMYNIFMQQLQAILPLDSNIPEAYSTGSSEEQAFIQNLALFFTSLFKFHIQDLESPEESFSLLLVGLEYLINISYVDDTEVFKICLDYWNLFVSELFNAQQKRRSLYYLPLSKLRELMISRMAKPEEVLIVEDENGNTVRQTMKDPRFEIMKQTLIYLTRIDHDDTTNKMLRKLRKQLSGEKREWNNLTTLCWAIGSISDYFEEDKENRFVMKVVLDLLKLNESTKGKDNKALISSNLMYVVGQYSNFIRFEWHLLKAGVNVLFFMMHQTHHGVQDMACNTFSKVVLKCKRDFIIVQVGEDEPFISTILSDLSTIVGDLKPHQIHSFYESVGRIIQAESDPWKRNQYLERLMTLPNQKWADIIGLARQNVDILKSPDMISTVLNILQTNTSVATSLGTFFLPQISLHFLDMLNVYKMYSELVSSSIADGGPHASMTPFVKLLRSVKRETLRLIKTFLGSAEYQPQIREQFVPVMMDPVLGDYARNLPDARESEVLSLCGTIINTYKDTMLGYMPHIFEAVFESTLEMITKNFEDYPEHRLKFYLLLHDIATFCIRALMPLSSQQLKLVMDSILWAIKHIEKNIAETGLNVLLLVLQDFEKSELCNQFYGTYFLQIEQEIFAVLTDTLHKPGFELHALVLHRLFCLVGGSSLTAPLWDAATASHPYPNNASFVCENTIILLTSAFTNMTTAEVRVFVNQLYELRCNLVEFKNRLRDFLVKSKEFSAQDNSDLYSEGASDHS